MLNTTKCFFKKAKYALKKEPQFNNNNKTLSSLSDPTLHWLSLHGHNQENTRMGKVNCRGKYVVNIWNDCRVKYMTASAGWQKKVPFESLIPYRNYESEYRRLNIFYFVSLCVNWILKPWVCIILFKGTQCFVHLNRQQQFQTNKYSLHLCKKLSFLS